MDRMFTLYFKLWAIAVTVLFLVATPGPAQAQTGPSSIRLDSIRPDNVKSDRINLNSIRSDSVRSDPIRIGNIRPENIRLNRINSGRINPDRIRPEKVKIASPKGFGSRLDRKRNTTPIIVHGTTSRLVRSARQGASAARRNASSRTDWKRPLEGVVKRILSDGTYEIEQKNGRALRFRGVLKGSPGNPPPKDITVGQKVRVQILNLMDERFGVVEVIPSKEMESTTQETTESPTR